MKPGILSEVRVFSLRHRFAGTTDLLGIWRGSGALLDYKTGSPRDVAADLQTAAYYAALVEMQAHGHTPDQIDFDPLLHAYYRHNERWPSVTQVIQRGGLADFSRVPKPILLAARDRGQAVHQAIHYYNDGDLDSAFRDDFPNYAGYLDAWVHFLDDSGFEFCDWNGLGDMASLKRYAVQLKKDGRYQVEPYAQASDFAEFLAVRQAQAIADRRRPKALQEFLDGDLRQVA